MKTCGDCKFYGSTFEHEDPEAGLQKYGFCHRYPPTPLAENKSSAALVRPGLRECGEFKPKAKARARK